MILDTHVLLWMLQGSDRLTGPVRRVIAEQRQVFASAVSVAEIRIKVGINKLQVPEQFEERLIDAGLSELPFTARHARALDQVPALTRHDPFDRMLVAQAQVERVDFLTADSRLLALGLDWITPAT